MKNMIEELWYGNLRPSERVIRGGSEYDGLRKDLSERLDEISPLLSENAQAKFEEIINGLGHMTALSEADAFVQGFRMGAKLIMDMMGEYEGQFEQV
ncbi:MAG: hypothetical protein E7638_02070 [Ruminococcaceae bacterium]|nr:hypothetical protein [Oscillospiraceae bacterium]